MENITRGQTVRFRYTTRSGRTWENTGKVLRQVGADRFEIRTETYHHVVVDSSDVLAVIY
jgi:hypothetical protein